MKIKIEQSEKDEQEIKRMFGRGLPAISYHFVTLTLELSNEEKSIIQKHNLGQLIFDRYENDSALTSLINEYRGGRKNTNITDAPIDLTLSRLATEEGFTRYFHSITEAANYAHALKTKILPQVKQTIEHYSTTSGVETFEL
jgi:hypothetical protein